MVRMWHIGWAAIYALDYIDAKQQMQSSINSQEWQVTQLNWQPPNDYKINFEGSFDTHSGTVGIGMVERNDKKGKF